MYKPNAPIIFAIQNKNLIDMDTIRTFADLRVAKLIAASDEAWDYAIEHIGYLPSTDNRYNEVFLDGLRDAIHGVFAAYAMLDYGKSANAYMKGWRAFCGSRKAMVLTR